ncbi:acyl carrier protein [Allorhizocola rhizosphaerae]|uniref:acyl carrier protein n=1 Tax=Allorhizocola rhizosphaerae TaxID=1872709 RepID=UPI000E3D09E1|nr:acyl carrier protein [Allorhizocola rhizosphaerae]
MTIDTEVGQRVRQVVEALAPMQDQSADDSARLVEDLGYHSLLLLELAFTVEEEFGLEPLDESRAGSIVVVGDLVAYVEAAVRERQ